MRQAPGTRHAEKIEWLNVWFDEADNGRRPRVLLIGDSIVMGYYDGVQKRLAGKAYVTRLATSRCVCDPAFRRELDYVLGEFAFDVIHFNNGLHGWDYTEAEYEAGLKQIVTHIQRKAPKSRLILALTTPVRKSGDVTKPDAAKTARVVRRNTLMQAVAATRGLAVNDLFSLVLPHPDYWVADGYHFTEAGRDAEATAVAAKLLAPKRKAASPSGR